MLSEVKKNSGIYYSPTELTKLAAKYCFYNPMRDDNKNVKAAKQKARRLQKKLMERGLVYAKNGKFDVYSENMKLLETEYVLSERASCGTPLHKNELLKDMIFPFFTKVSDDFRKPFIEQLLNPSSYKTIFFSFDSKFESGKYATQVMSALVTLFCDLEKLAAIAKADESYVADSVAKLELYLKNTEQPNRDNYDIVYRRIKSMHTSLKEDHAKAQQFRVWMQTGNRPKITNEEIDNFISS